MPLTPLPPEPLRDEGSKIFVPKAFAFVSSLYKFRTEINAMEILLNSLESNAAQSVVDASASAASAQLAAATALSSANFAGRWADQSGAATIPLCVFHDGTFWHCSNPSGIADITLSIPGTNNNDWVMADPMATRAKDFEHTDLVGGILTYVHSLETEFPSGVAVYNAEKVRVIPSEIKSIDSDTISVDLAAFGAFTGTWHLRVRR